CAREGHAGTARARFAYW
nr:immunoglobulin heavy chain junction region [Mus musculus]